MEDFQMWLIKMPRKLIVQSVRNHLSYAQWVLMQYSPTCSQPATKQKTYFFLNILLKSALRLHLNVRHKSECSSLLFEKTLIQALTGISPSAVMLCFSIHIYANNPIGSVILFYFMFLCFCPHSFRVFWGTKAISPTSKSRRIV